MSKKIAIRTRPTAKETPSSADAWVGQRDLSDVQEATKRITIDIPASLHRTIKIQCAMRGTKLSDEIRDLLLQKYGNHQNLFQSS